MAEETRIIYLLRQYVENTCTKSELEELLGLIGDAENKPVLQDFLEEEWLLTEVDGKKPPINRDEIFRNIISAREGKVIHIERSQFRWRFIAAAVILVIAVSLFFLFDNAKKPTTISRVAVHESDIKPGGNKAVLQLSNGSQILLDTAANGLLAIDGNVKIVKLSAGEIAYEPQKTGSVNNLRNHFNTIYTPKAGKYKITLPDGSNVWMNAASKLQFPIELANSNDRKIALDGEAYFEVKSIYTSAAHKTKIPFAVTAHGTKIEVLGTHFNTMAYTDESNINTTLLEGSVKVSCRNNAGMLKPGQQAVTNNTDKIIIGEADTEKAIAWKNDMFEFKGDDFAYVMRQLARWYDIDVVYEGAIPKGHYSGSISRNVNISQVLHLMELSGINFKIEGKKVIVIA